VWSTTAKSSADAVACASADSCSRRTRPHTSISYPTSKGITAVVAVTGPAPVGVRDLWTAGSNVTTG
jgi:hypothetical protein